MLAEKARSCSWESAPIAAKTAIPQKIRPIATGSAKEKPRSAAVRKALRAPTLAA